jgi:hypothetical protein
MLIPGQFKISWQVMVLKQLPINENLASIGAHPMALTKDKIVDSIYTKHDLPKNRLVEWDDRSRLKAAVLVDVDGTLASTYQEGNRQLRPTALSAIKTLSNHAPVFLWSVAGAENAERLTSEFPQLMPYIAGCYDKKDFPLELVENLYCIDDEEFDSVVLQCNYVILNETYDGGPDSGLLMEATRSIVNHMSEAIGLAVMD